MGTKAVGTIDTDALSARYRSASVDTEGRRLLVTNFRGTAQEFDFSEPANCDGFGRIRHFRRAASSTWSPNPLPIDPACRALGLSPCDTLRAQVFQNAVCNWRCWYCFVPFNLLAANPTHSAWLSPEELVDLYLAEDDPPAVIDLTGGQPDLTPEWVPWVMTELCARGLEQTVYLWSDDNLSNDYFWRFLTNADRNLVVSYPNYGRVCCFKGFDDQSFAFNTRAAPALFGRQFDLMRRFLELGIDVYAYATFTAPPTADIPAAVSRFIDRLQTLHHNLPLRTVPLEIEVFTPVRSRLTDATRLSLDRQWHAISAWREEMEKRFSHEERVRPIVDVPL